MKIVLLQDDFPPEGLGGAASVCINIALKLKDLGHEVVVISSTQKDKDVTVFYRGVKVVRIFSNYALRWQAYVSLYNPMTVKKVKEILQQEKPQIVWCHNIHRHLSYYCLKLSHDTGAKVYLTIHDTMLFHYGKFYEFASNGNFHVSIWQQIKRAKFTYNPFRNLIIKYFLRYTDELFAVSYLLKEVLNQNGIHNVRVDYNGIDVNCWKRNKIEVEKLKTKFNLKGKRVITFIGRLSWAKGAVQVIEVLAGVTKVFPKTVLLVIGENNPYVQKLSQKAKNIITTGRLEGEELKAAYYSSDVIIFPSLCFETFGMVCLEAMACKKPVVATSFGGPSEVVINGKTGYIVNPYNIGEMIVKVSALFRNTRVALLFGRAGFHRAKTMFDLEVQIRQVLNYNKLR